MTFVARLSDALWQPWLLGLFLLVGGYYSLRTGFFQLFRFRVWMRTAVGGLFGRRKAGKGQGITQLQALATALAATIGTGSIAGVATAIYFGGPGAVFWMWVSAFLGMMTGFAEKTLAVRYRRLTPTGWKGGPMCYMKLGLGWDRAARLFSLALIAQTLTGGGMVQANSIASALSTAFGWDRLLIGIVVALFTGAVVLGGIGRIGRVSELLVPLMALLFLGGGVVVLIANRRAIPAALYDIVTYAVQPKALAGGYSAFTALRYGVARGVFTNEAGMGSSAIAHAAAEGGEPAEQGMRGMFEVFFATLVICTVSALVVLTSGLYTVEGAQNTLATGTVSDKVLGAPLTAASFAVVLGTGGYLLVSTCLVLFAFTSLLGAGFYGQRGVESLTERKAPLRLFQAAFLSSIVLGSMSEVAAVWDLADLFNGLLALPNLIALLALSPEVLRLWREWEERRTRRTPSRS